jgi:uncharacterized protein (DUF1778 family)
MVKPTSRERPIYTLRLARAERRILEAAAAQRDLYLAEFIRLSALEAARRLLSESTAPDEAIR